MIKNLKIATKLNILLAGVLLTLTLIVGLVISSLMTEYVQQIISDRTLLLMETITETNKYQKIQPELVSNWNKNTEFSEKEIVGDLLDLEEYKNFLDKEATIKPLNFQDKADRFETKLIQDFNHDPMSQRMRSL